MKLVLPLPPNVANTSFGHWAVKLRRKRAYDREVQVALQNQRARWRGRTWPSPVRITATLYTYNRMDVDNLYARLKWAIDCLVRAGLLVDDNPAGVTLQATQQIDRKRQRLELDFAEDGNA